MPIQAKNNNDNTIKCVIKDGEIVLTNRWFRTVIDKERFELKDIILLIKSKGKLSLYRMFYDMHVNKCMKIYRVGIDRSEWDLDVFYDTTFYIDHISVLKAESIIKTIKIIYNK